MAEYRAIKIERGSGGFGGPLTVMPKEGKDKVVFITGGGAEPDIIEKIVKLTGCTAVNGFKTSVPDEEIFLAVPAGHPLAGQGCRRILRVLLHF